jgi:hypothetical protein
MHAIASPDEIARHDGTELASGHVATRDRRFVTLGPGRRETRSNGTVPWPGDVFVEPANPTWDESPRTLYRRRDRNAEERR